MTSLAEHQERIFVGCAGWSLPRLAQPRFPPEGTHLQRYAAVFSAVEINSSFYRPHRPQTYARWQDSVPSDFRFSVKIPKAITHGRRLRDSEGLLDDFVSQVSGLGNRLGCLLVQLPPSLRFECTIVTRFMSELRARSLAPIVCEPRHASWFTADAEELLRALEVARVAADPAIVPAAAVPGGWPKLVYYRLHGSPRIYYSDYPADYLESTARRLCAAAETAREAWCIFDNTALGAATDNALEVLAQTRTHASV